MSEKKRLAIILTHPVQYYSPIFELLSARNNIHLKVFYTWGDSVLHNKYDPGFGRIVDWDIPLLKGYDYTFVENTAKQKGSDHYTGIINPYLHTVVEAYKPNAVLFYGWPFHSHLKAIRYFKKKVPVLFRGDSTLLDDSKGIRKYLRFIFLRWVYSYVDYAFYTGKSSYDYFIKCGLKPKQLVFTPHAVENERFAQNHHGTSVLRQALNIAPGDFVFLFAGKLEQKKAVDVLIKAFIHAGCDNTVHLVITGNGPREADYKLQAEAYDNIHFLDFQNQVKMPEIYQMCDVFILPSQGPGETWGLAVNEAMAAGKPVIVSNKCGCAADLVITKQTGFVFESGNVTDLSYYINWFVSNKSEAVRMGLLATVKIKNYSFGAIAAATERLVFGI